MNPLNTIKELKNFDAISRFRLFNAFCFAASFNLLLPILIDVKGEYLTAWAISLFLIGEVLVVKTNKYVSTFSITTIYRVGIILHICLVLCAFLYFVDPLLMIIAESVLMIFVVGVFGVYSIKLNNYLTYWHPTKMNDFQILRNSIRADGLLLGLICATVISFIWGNSVSVLIFIVCNAIYSMWLINNWHFYDEHVLANKI